MRQDYIHQPQYSNRALIPYANWRQIHIFLDTPDQKPENPTESNLKHRAFIEFELINNRLYRQSDKRYPDPRYVAPESEAMILLLMNIYNSFMQAGIRFGQLFNRSTMVLPGQRLPLC